MNAKNEYLKSKQSIPVQNGGFLNLLSNLLNDTEVAPVHGNKDEDKLNRLRSLLQDSEVNNLTGGAQKLRDLLLQDTESLSNFKGIPLEKKRLIRNYLLRLLKSIWSVNLLN
jgi:hypothetical protein